MYSRFEGWFIFFNSRLPSHLRIPKYLNSRALVFKPFLYIKVEQLYAYRV